MIEDPQVSEGFDEGVDASPIADALEAARRLLAAAEAEASRLRAEAEQHALRREQEAELLIAKARRVLEAAEARASVIVESARGAAAARASGATAPEIVDVRSDADLTSARPASRRMPRATRFDSLLANAIANAVDDAFPEHTQLT